LIHRDLRKLYALSQTLHPQEMVRVGCVDNRLLSEAKGMPKITLGEGCSEWPGSSMAQDAVVMFALCLVQEHQKEAQNQQRLNGAQARLLVDGGRQQ
jgi:hypothetical protein